MGEYKKLFAYEKAFELTMDIFEITKSFPAEEKYSLLIKSEDHQDLFVQILRKHIGDVGIKTSLFPN